jgi:hypothetical protein
MRHKSTRPSREWILDWITNCLIGDLRTLEDGIIRFEADKANPSAQVGRGGGNYLLAVGCLMAVEYFGRILCTNPAIDAVSATRQYAQRFLGPVDERYPRFWDLLWSAFRNGLAHGSMPKLIELQDDPCRKLVLGVGNSRDDPHFSPHPDWPHSLMISAPLFLDDLDSSVRRQNGFGHWILVEADDDVLDRAGPEILKMSASDPRLRSQFDDAFNGRFSKLPDP